MYLTFRTALIVLCLGILAPPAVAPDAPKADGAASASALAFERSAKNFGRAQEGRIVHIAFPVRNTSEKTVTITGISTGCGCTAVHGNPWALEPGEETEFRFAYDSTGRPGNANQTVTVRTDEEGGRAYRLLFTGTIYTPVRFTQSPLDFGEVLEGTGATRQVSLVSILPQPVMVHSVHSQDERIGVELVEERPFESDDGSGQEFVLELRLSDDMPQRSFATMIMVETSEARNPHRLVVRGRVVGDLSVTPERIFAVLAAGEEESRTVIFRSRGEKPVEIVSVEVDENLPLRVRTESGSAAHEALLHAAVEPPDERGTIQGKVGVTVRSGVSGDMTRIEVPVVLIVRGAAPAQVTD